MRYRCKECGGEFAEEGEADFHAYDAHEMDYEDCIKEIEEEATIDSTPEGEENLDEESAVKEREVDTVTALKLYDKIEDESLKKQVLSVALGFSTGQDKKIPSPVKVGEAFKVYFERAVDKLSDERMTSCPVCGIAWSRIEEEMKERLSGQHSELETKIPIIRILHVKVKHEALWRVLKHLFGRDATEIPDEGRVSTTPNPEQCTETLSRDELAEEISKSPELRKEFYRKWIETLQERE